MKKKIAKFLIDLPSSLRRIILIFIDVLLINISLFLTLWCLTDNRNSFISEFNFLISLQTSLLGIFVFVLGGQYKGLIRYFSSSSLYKLSVRNIIFLILLFITNNFFANDFTNLKYWVIFIFILTFLTSLFRVFIRDFLQFLNFLDASSAKRVIIYGAGSAGALLYSSIKSNKNFSLQYFIDDNSKLWNRNLDGILIKSPTILKNLENIDLILLAIPSLSFRERNNLIQKLNAFNIPLMQMPTLADLTNGKAKFDQIKPILIEDLLERKPLPREFETKRFNFKNKVVCITGSGGSIGSELSRQVLNQMPNKIILIENHEPSLYKIYNELSEIIETNHLKFSKKDLLPKLINISDSFILNKLFKKEKIDIVFHTAAFKHVPIIEENQISGLYNNIESSINICEASKANSIEKVILISSDKAVRPSSLMGCSKRLCELIFKFYDLQCQNTIFSMVRFGNVLNSSGSVVPLFRKQISQGGPITVTHPEIIRYFMTIKEAAHLVIQSSNLAKGGDIFLLDMGNPVKIVNLAKQMILQSGLSIKDHNNPNGDIEINFTGLRPGEKLYEELLVGNKSEETKHPLIFKDSEEIKLGEDFFEKLQIMRKSLISNDLINSLSILEKLIPEYRSNLRKKNN